jgi:hypothetical protein
MKIKDFQNLGVLLFCVAFNLKNNVLKSFVPFVVKFLLF